MAAAMPTLRVNGAAEQNECELRNRAVDAV